MISIICEEIQTKSQFKKKYVNLVKKYEEVISLFICVDHNLSHSWFNVFQLIIYPILLFLLFYHHL